MNITTANGRVAIVQVGGILQHTINDDPNNKLKKPALLYVSEATDVKVTFENGTIGVIKNYNMQFYALVFKVWANGTTTPEAVQLFD